MLLVLTTVLGGCSSGGDADADADQTASTSPTASSSPTEPPPEPVDPCSLLSAEDLEAAGLTPDPDTEQRGLLPDPRTTACLVPDRKDGWSVFYGYSLVPGVSVADAVQQVGTEKPARLDVGDQARLVLYNAYGDKTWHAWARQGRYTVMVELFAKPRPARVEGLLGRMLEQVDPAMFDFPVDLPESCPPARSRPIRALLGEVRAATGSDVDGEVRCSYANRPGLVLNLDISPIASSKKVAGMVGSVGQYFDERTTPARGVTLFLSPEQPYGFTRAYVAQPPSSRGTDLQRQQIIGRYYRPTTFDEQKYRALAAWWATRD
ncbi:hypothetical protein PD653_0476 [Nocardioides sp. PD653]|nr:hypothetical protein PD653B2_2691 [Nocardioides sp. PD653-B2]GAW53079.1 hypothetical protein PD653_0476 [Nocardioides sp. PD653]